MKDLEEFIAKCEANGKPYSEIDLSDSPELTEADFERGQFKNLKQSEKTIVFRAGSHSPITEMAQFEV